MMDELVSRQAVIDALRTCYDTETISMDNGDEYINYGDAVGEIEQLPPIQPKLLQPWEVLAAQAVLSQPAEPKRIRGRWIYSSYDDESGFDESWECDKCGYMTNIEETNFCPNCGADMRGVNNESN